MKIMVDATVDEDGSLVLVIKNPERLFEKKTPAKPKTKANEVIAHYCDVYTLRYKISPHITPKTAGVAKRIAKQMTIDRAKQLISHYLEMDNFFFVQRRHDLAIFENSINTVHVSLETGLNITDKNARSGEQTQQSVNAARSWLGSKQDS